MPGASPQKRRVLVIDDDENIRRIIRHFLEQAGFEVYTAPDGDAGLKSAVAAPPDAILLDVMMPVKDGFNACAELKRLERTRNVPVIFLTCKSGDEPWTMARHRGAAAYLEKPFRHDALVALVHEVIDQHEEERRTTPPASKSAKGPRPARKKTPQKR
ncbi:MAG: response regulator [Planctomycetes bacterium]|nr:response regulator [Planctomycetota bacterium]